MSTLYIAGAWQNGQGEAFESLDPVTQQETLALLAQHASEHGCAVLLVTHDTDISTRMAMRVIRLG